MISILRWLLVESILFVVMGLIHARVAKLADATGREPESWWFESTPSHQNSAGRTNG